MANKTRRATRKNRRLTGGLFGFGKPSSEVKAVNSGMKANAVRRTIGAKPRFGVGQLLNGQNVSRMNERADQIRKNTIDSIATEYGIQPYELRNAVEDYKNIDYKNFKTYSDRVREVAIALKKKFNNTRTNLKAKYNTARANWKASSNAFAKSVANSRVPNSGTRKTNYSKPTYANYAASNAIGSFFW